MKFIVTDRNVTYPEENCQVISQVKSILSNVEKALSSVCVKMLWVNVETRKKILPNVSQILYQVETIVSSSSQPLDTATDLWWDESGLHQEESYGCDDSNLSDVFLFSKLNLTSPSQSPTPIMGTWGFYLNPVFLPRPSKRPFVFETKGLGPGLDNLNKSRHFILDENVTLVFDDNRNSTII